MFPVGFPLKTGHTRRGFTKVCFFFWGGGRLRLEQPKDTHGPFPLFSGWEPAAQPLVSDSRALSLEALDPDDEAPRQRLLEMAKKLADAKLKAGSASGQGFGSVSAKGRETRKPKNKETKGHQEKQGSQGTGPSKT